MEKNSYKKYERAAAVIIMLVIFFFTAATLITNGRYALVSAKKNSIDIAGEDDSIFDIEQMLFSSFEDAYGESVFLHEKITPLASALNSLFMGERTIESSQVLLGKEDWLFYKTKTDGDPLADYSGTELFSDELLLSITNNLKDMQSRLAAQGIEFAVMIVPNKEQIYSKYMPDTIIRCSETSRTDLLVQHIEQNSDIKLVYPKDEFIQLADDYPLYYKYDSHWNELGAFVAYQQLMEKLFSEREYLADKTFSSHADTYREHADLLDMTGLYTWFGYDDFYSIDGSASEKQDKTVLVVGDSCRVALERYFNEGFKNAVIVHRQDYTPSLLNEVKPDIVILEYVERYSGWMDGFSLFE